jgi:hypothetical protein
VPFDVLIDHTWWTLPTGQKGAALVERAAIDA